MKISNNMAVSIHYTLTNDAGEVLDSSSGKEPLSYLHGSHGIIPGLEEQLEGKSIGDSFKATIAPENGYGTYSEELIQTVSLKQFQDPSQVQVGAQFHVQAGEQVQVATITSVEGEDVTLDLNHPLAGETLHFDVSVEAIREATQEELDHGHVHGEGGHNH